MSEMLFETVTTTIKHSIGQARKLTKSILNVQNFYLKKTNDNKIFILKKKLQKIRIILNDSGELWSL